MKVGLKNTKCCWCRLTFLKQRHGHLKRLLFHLEFNALSVFVDLIQHLSELFGAMRLGCDQAFNPKRHVRQSACGIDSWANGKAQIIGAKLGVYTRANVDQCPKARGHESFFDALQALVD